MAPMTVGSSPRTRGTRRSWCRLVLPWRFIPAHAGNTCHPSHTSPLVPVHPRARGEHTVRVRRLAQRGGSSPRTRGTHLAAEWQQSRIRFIPAHAGNTGPTATGATGSPVHPRARGEHTPGQLPYSIDDGSSPRTRGTPIAPSFLTGASRFIPAHAGNTQAWQPRQCRSSVHPRARGEHEGPPSSSGCFSGSSPRTRGTR